MGAKRLVFSRNNNNKQNKLKRQIKVFKPINKIKNETLVYQYSSNIAFKKNGGINLSNIRKLKIVIK